MRNMKTSDPALVSHRTGGFRLARWITSGCWCRPTCCWGRRPRTTSRSSRWSCPSCQNRCCPTCSSPPSRSCRTRRCRSWSSPSRGCRKLEVSDPEVPDPTLPAVPLVLGEELVDPTLPELPLVLGDVEDDPGVAELSVGVPVVAELPVEVPVVAELSVDVPVVALPEDPVVDPLTLPEVPLRVSRRRGGAGRPGCAAGPRSRARAGRPRTATPMPRSRCFRSCRNYCRLSVPRRQPPSVRPPPESSLPISRCSSKTSFEQGRWSRRTAM